MGSVSAVTSNDGSHSLSVRTLTSNAKLRCAPSSERRGDRPVVGPVILRSSSGASPGTPSSTAPVTCAGEANNISTATEAENLPPTTVYGTVCSEPQASSTSAAYWCTVQLRHFLCDRPEPAR